MSLKAKDRARLNVEALEARQLLSAAVTSTLPTPLTPVIASRAGSQPQVNYGSTLQPTAATPAHVLTRTYAVVSLRNTTRAAVHFAFRWGPSQAWTKYTVPAGSSYYFWAYGLTGAPQVHFDADPSAGTQAVQYTLNYKVVTRTTPPGYADALHYAIARTGKTLAVNPSAG